MEGADPAWTSRSTLAHLLGFGVWQPLLSTVGHPLPAKTRPLTNFLSLYNPRSRTHSDFLHPVETLPSFSHLPLHCCATSIRSFLPTPQRFPPSLRQTSGSVLAPGSAFLFPSSRARRSVPPANSSTRWIMTIAQNYNHAIPATSRQCGQRERYAPPFTT